MIHILRERLKIVYFFHERTSYFLFAEATGAISQGYAFCKYVVQPL